jgi:type VI secretion system secreted protein Hcp
MPIYMQFPGATGGVSAQGFQGWIELTSASFGMDRPSDSRIGTSGYAATGKLQVHNITVSKTADGASPQLTIAALQGTFDKTVQIAFVTTSQSGMTNFMSYQLTNCGISSAHTDGDQTGTPKETYSLSFGQIQFTFNNMDQAGRSSPTITGYNLETATSL